MKLFGRVDLQSLESIDVIFLYLIELTLGDVFNILPNLFSAFINKRFVQVRGITFLVFVFIVNLPLVMYLVYYLLFSENCILCQTRSEL